ncbi:hypothetical protein E1265_17505 [Streptomyces sp. 8K308]|uniref:hypothetical protein n=1 Tax=Streptomyces sp. 8K308 TaxID=2530388 RepID=UPI00104DE707|nr:hypothetical protein [Streptomyces sp. 8K308]TDC21630.1 hypothetical protein E1265_17505 [Streptomyces sp. 8K308]
MNRRHDGVPIAGYDELSAGEIGHRIRSLSRPDLAELLSHERDHADRPQVVQLIRARLAELDAGATPTPGGREPARPAPTPHEGTVRPATAAEPSPPPPHGTPDQPGKPRSA